MTLEQLRNPAPKNSNVSFLRRTQYIAAGSSRGAETPAKAAISALKTAQSAQAPKPKLSRDDPIHIKKYIQKGFDIAYPQSKHTGEDTATKIRGLPATKAELDTWANPVHPDNPKLKPVGFYPVIPDLGGFPDPGGFLQFKFDKAPVQGASGKRDDRTDVGILVPAAPEERVCQEHAAKTALHKANPALYPDPGPIPWDYDLFLPERKKDAAKKIRRTLNVANPERDDDDDYTHEGPDGTKYHRYDRVRTYATSTQALSTEQKYKDVGLILFDPAEIPEGSQNQYRLKQKGAYYYPIIGKTRLKPERARTIAQAGLAPTRLKPKEDQVDQIQVVVRDPNEVEAYKRATHRAQVDSRFAKTMPPPPDEIAKDGISIKKVETQYNEAELIEDGDEMEINIRSKYATT
jgi:hypothetical protein